jgi:hypothetical protein
MHNDDYAVAIIVEGETVDDNIPIATILEEENRSDCTDAEMFATMLCVASLMLFFVYIFVGPVSHL